MKTIKENICIKINQSCVVCQAQESTALCLQCRSELPWVQASCYYCAIPVDMSVTPYICLSCRRHPPAFDHCHAAFEYRFPVSMLLKHAKQLMGVNLLTPLTDCLAESLSNQPQHWPDALVPVPLHRSRLLQRGFNQAELIANQLSQHLRIPVLAQHLVRLHSTRSQASLNAKDRQHNLHSTFALERPLPRHIALVDDVLTTGATAHTISRYLKLTGVERVDVWVLARTPAPEQR